MHYVVSGVTASFWSHQRCSASWRWNNCGNIIFVAVVGKFCLLFLLCMCVWILGLMEEMRMDQDVWQYEVLQKTWLCRQNWVLEVLCIPPIFNKKTLNTSYPNKPNNSSSSSSSHLPFYALCLCSHFPILFTVVDLTLLYTQVFTLTNHLSVPAFHIAHPIRWAGKPVNGFIHISKN